MSKRCIREGVNQMPLTLYLSAVQKVEVMPDRASQSDCDNTLIAKPESGESKVRDTLSVTTNSATDNSNKKRKNT